MRVHIKSDGTIAGTRITEVESGDVVIADYLQITLDARGNLMSVECDISEIEVEEINGMFDATNSELIRLRAFADLIAKYFDQIMTMEFKDGKEILEWIMGDDHGLSWAQARGLVTSEVRLKPVD